MAKSKKKKGVRMTPKQRPAPIPAPIVIRHAKEYDRNKVKANLRKEVW
ncbi:MAG: hypothetical protein ACI4UE_03930 [Candidatus Scatovivens sp.]